MMKILMFSETFGNITFIYNQVVDLAKNHHVKYVCNHRIYEEHFPYENVTVIPFEFNQLYNRIRLRLELHDIRLNLKHKSFAKQFKQVINQFEPDIIHCQFGYEAIKIFDNYYNPDVTFVIAFRGYDATKKLNWKTYRNRIKNILALPNVFPIFVCNFLKENFKKHKISFNKSLILYSNTDTDFFKRRNKDHPKSPFIFLQVSSFREKKGHEFTLRAFNLLKKRLPGKNFQMWFTGKKIENFGNANALANKLKLQNDIKFLGWTSPEQTRDLMEKAHAVVLHSITTDDGDQEGVPNSLMEAMSMELPVVSTYHAGIPELVKNNINGYLVKEKDINAFSLAMEKSLTVGYLPENRTKIIKDFSKEQHILKLKNFYHESLQSLDTSN